MDRINICHDNLPMSDLYLKDVDSLFELCQFGSNRELFYKINLIKMEIKEELYTLSDEDDIEDVSTEFTEKMVKLLNVSNVDVFIN